MKKVEDDYDLLTESDYEFINRLAKARPTPESIAAADKIAELQTILYGFDAFETEYGNAKDRLKKECGDYRRLHTKKRLRKIVKVLNELKSIKEKGTVYIQKLKDFESLLDTKYWDENILDQIETKLRIGLAQTIEEAVKLLNKV